jgi:protein disulfide-isomerase A1
MAKNLLIFSIFVVALAFADVAEEDDVLVLNRSNFDQVIEANERILVEFYAPWCGHCKNLAPEYSKAAKTLKGDEAKVPLAKVDSTSEIELAAKFNIQGYPTLKYFVQGKPVDYTGGRKESEIVSWVRKRASPISQLVSSAKELEDLVAKAKLVAIYCGPLDSEAFKVYSRAALAFDDITFAHSADGDVRASTGAVSGEISIVLYKPFDDGKNIFYGPHEDSFVMKFLDDHQYPTVMNFDQKAAEKIFGRNLEALFILAETANSEAAVAALKDAGLGLKSKIELAYALYEDSLGQRLAEFLGVSKAQLPAARIIRFQGEDIKKYAPNTDQINTENLLNFYTDYRTGKSKSTYKSEARPQSNDGAVKVVVGESFNEVVLDSSVDVFVMFYAPWCGHCKQLEPVYEELAKKLQGSSGLRFAKIDATANEVEDVAISGFPTLKYYPAKDKKKPIDYNGDRTEEAILEFLKKSGAKIGDVKAEL